MRWGKEENDDMRVEESVEIDRPVEEVFSYVANPENLPEWSSIVLDVRKETQGPPKEGDRFTSVSKFLGRRFETPFEVVSYEPPGGPLTGAREDRSHRSGPGPLSKRRGAVRACRR
jgi:hypothetical protein